MSEDSDFLSFMAVQLMEFQFQRFNTDIIRQLDKIRQGCSQLPIINTGLINVSTHFWIIQYTYFLMNRFEKIGIVQCLKLKINPVWHGIGKQEKWSLEQPRANMYKN